MKVIPRKEAKHKKLPRYFTGKSCIQGHLSEKNTINGRCCECASVYEKNHRAEIAEKLKIKNADPVYKNKIKQRTNQWKLKNPKQTKHRYDTSNLKNKEYINNWHAENKTAVLANSKKYRELHPEVMLISSIKRRAKKLQAIPPWSDDVNILKIYQLRDEMTLASKAAGCPIQFVVDHYYPLNSDQVCGLHCQHNLQIIPKEENGKKSNRMPNIFYGDTNE